MPRIQYINKRFSTSSKILIDKANIIIREYQKQGYDLTLRQLYYQFVSRDWISNTLPEYKRLGSVVADARLAGLIDWEAITDRTRNLRKNPHFASPGSAIKRLATIFAYDKWLDQTYRPEVWIEKDALIGIVEDICENLDVPYFSCRGYTSISEIWSASQRLANYHQIPYIIHLGDHDPSGIDMSRDIVDRLKTFKVDFRFKRIALNYDQVEQYNPPPNPTKAGDTRSRNYAELYGRECWELDALSPSILGNLIKKAIISVRDDTKWIRAVARDKEEKEQIYKCGYNWESVNKFLKRMRNPAVKFKDAKEEDIDI